MNETPKCKRASLSLGRRLQKRQNGSPKQALSTDALYDVHTPHTSGKSKQLLEVMTPPHYQQRCESDDSFEASPRVIHGGDSPIIMGSQTFSNIEVDWRWGSADKKRDNIIEQRQNIKSSKCRAAIRRCQNERRDKASHINVKQKQLRKRQNSYVVQSLMERCDKLQEQLHKELDLQHEQTLISISDKTAIKKTTTVRELEEDERLVVALQSTNCSTPVLKKHDDINDFFNDSESDNLLLAASQQIEQNNPSKTEKSTASANCSSSNISTPTSSKQKRDSFYMKFLEEDFPEEWLSALDTVLEDAQQSKKSRNCLQRYNSMPSDHVKSANAIVKAATTTKTSTTETATSSSNAKLQTLFKRHASAVSISPSSSNYHGHQIHRRK